MTVAVRPSLLARCRRSASELTVRQRTVGWVYHGLCDREVRGQSLAGPGTEPVVKPSN